MELGAISPISREVDRCPMYNDGDLVISSLGSRRFDQWADVGAVADLVAFRTEVIEAAGATLCLVGCNLVPTVYLSLSHWSTANVFRGHAGCSTGVTTGFVVCSRGRSRLGFERLGLTRATSIAPRFYCAALREP